jgi:hypothetical protein
MFLTWHHFDPPWNVKKHHQPEGMVALCRPHHDAADRDVYSVGELRALKHAAANIPARGEFPWAKKQFLVRLGGNYSAGTGAPLAVSGTPIISLRKSAEGLVFLSFTLHDADGAVIAEMEDNCFSVDPARVTDIEATTGGTSLKFWVGPRAVGLHLSFQRLTLYELSRTLAADFGRSLKEAPREIGQDILEAGDWTGGEIWDWAVANCLDDERRVSLLDFRNLAIYVGGRQVVVRDGIGPLFTYCAAVGCDVGFNLGA